MRKLYTVFSNTNKTDFFIKDESVEGEDWAKYTNKILSDNWPGTSYITFYSTNKNIIQIFECNDIDAKRLALEIIYNNKKDIIDIQDYEGFQKTEETNK